MFRWIGSLELGLFLEHALGVECRTASYQSGDDVAADGRRLAHHFSLRDAGDPGDDRWRAARLQSIVCDGPGDVV